MDVNKSRELGDGLGCVYHPRRLGHQDPYLLLCYDITRITKIINRPTGITIVCELYAKSGHFKFEHFDVWYAPNAKKKLREYFSRKSKSSLRRLSHGRLKKLIVTVMNGDVNKVNIHGVLVCDRPPPIYTPIEKDCKINLYESIRTDTLAMVPKELTQAVPRDRRSMIREFLNIKLSDKFIAEKLRAGSHISDIR